MLQMDLAGDDSRYQVEAFVGVEVVPVAVDPEQQDHERPGGAFVAVDERVKTRHRLQCAHAIMAQLGMANQVRHEPGERSNTVCELVELPLGLFEHRSQRSRSRAVARIGGEPLGQSHFQQRDG